MKRTLARLIAFSLLIEMTCGLAHAQTNEPRFECYPPEGYPELVFPNGAAECDTYAYSGFQEDPNDDTSQIGYVYGDIADNGIFEHFHEPVWAGLQASLNVEYPFQGCSLGNFTGGGIIYSTPNNATGIVFQTFSAPIICNGNATNFTRSYRSETVMCRLGSRVASWETFNSYVGNATTHSHLCEFCDLNDCDQDSVDDHSDNCLGTSNATQVDTDSDGLGNACDADFNNDCIVNFSDLQQMKNGFFGANPLFDLNADQQVNFADLQILKDLFFGTPGPSALPNLCDATAEFLFDDFEDIGPDGTTIVNRTVGGTTVLLSTGSGIPLESRTYFVAVPRAFIGANGEPNAPWDPSAVSLSRFISTNVEGLGGITVVQPVIFEFSQPIRGFGITTLDLLEDGVPAEGTVTLSAFDANGMLVGTQTRQGEQGPRGLALDWLISTESAVITRVELSSSDIGPTAGYGLDDMLVRE